MCKCTGSRIILLCGAICGPLTSGLEQREISYSMSANNGIMIANGIYWTTNALLYLLANLDHFDVAFCLTIGCHNAHFSQSELGADLRHGSFFHQEPLELKQHMLFLLFFLYCAVW